jgi:hypothetical protein
MNRRTFLVSTSAVLTAATAFAQDVKGPATAPKAPAKPPVLPSDKVKEVVLQAHRSLDAVRALVEETPNLVHARWDWGGGDFETPMEAAAHTGHRDIAEYLFSRNARFDLYAAAMLGQLDVVKAILAPDVVRLASVPGPHGFTLLHCAKQGGEAAKPVFDFLVGAGVPQVFMSPLPYKWPEGKAPAQ